MEEKISIGVSGIATVSEQLWVTKVFTDLIGKNCNLDFILRIGILTNAKRLSGEPIGHEWLSRYPDQETIRAILRVNDQDSSAEHFIHYSTDQENLNLLDEHLEQLTRLARPNITGLQINCPIWLEPQETAILRKLKSQGLRIILQVNSHHIASILAPITLIKRLSACEGAVDEVLIDTSMGQGKPLNTVLTRILLWSVRDSLPWLKTGVAGGFTGETAERLLSELKPFMPNIDAEGGLRDSDGALSLDKVASYLKTIVAHYSHTH